MGTKKRKILIWDRYGSTSSKYVLSRFRDEGHGEVFSEEGPSPVGRASYLVNEFIEGKTGSNILLILSRDALVADLIALLAAQHGVRTLLLPRWPGMKFDLSVGRQQVLSMDEDFDALIASIDNAQPYEVAERERRELVTSG